MRDDEGYVILHNGVPQTFRDNRQSAFEAARYAKSRTKGEIIEIIDRSCVAASAFIILNEIAGDANVVQSRFMKALAEPAAFVDVAFGDDNPWQIRGSFQTGAHEAIRAIQLRSPDQNARMGPCA